MEIFVEIQENVRGADVFIIQSTSFPANDNLMELLIIIDALRRASARRITAVIPYFGYARQDRKSGSRTPISAKLVANLITHAGVDRVMTLDLHAGQIQGFFDIPTDNLFASPVMVRDITRTLRPGQRHRGVARRRRRGARARARQAHRRAARHRRQAPRTRRRIRGDERDRRCAPAVPASWSTTSSIPAARWCNAADALLANGAKEVYAYITHGVLSGGAAARIIGSRLKELVITNSILPTEAVRRCQEYPHAIDCAADRRSDRPHRLGRIGVESVRLRGCGSPRVVPANAGTHTRRPLF